jgi:prepilin-type N-terminal cleavage/methylation domain-containing protein
MASAKRIQPGRRGLTLIELLMVVSIMTILLVVAIPMMRPAFQDRYLREGARTVSAFFAGAQARAAELGRPVGVWIERVDGTELGSRQAVRLYMAEVPPSFTGALLDSRVRVAASGTTGTLQFEDANDGIVLGTIMSVGERFTIKFDHKGYDYVGECKASAFEITIPTGVVPPGAEVAGRGVPYEITRGPTRSSVNPLVLPADSTIDLSLSGMGTTGRQLDSAIAAPWTATPVVIMFAPSGRVDYMLIAGQPVRPFAPIHLLVGRRARVVNPLTTDLADREKTNLADPTCLWVTISERTGSIFTSDNADTSFVPPVTPPPPYDHSVRMKAARELARSSVQKGGR